jgi:hypothetical protein
MTIKPTKLTICNTYFTFTYTLRKRKVAYIRIEGFEFMQSNKNNNKSSK